MILYRPVAEQEWESLAPGFALQSLHYYYYIYQWIIVFSGL